MTSFNNNQTNIGAPTQRRHQYAFHHSEGDGFLHVAVLGQGIQGTATLVRPATTYPSTSNTPLVVRKRTAATDNTTIDPFADQFHLPHTNIVQLLGCQNYRDAEGRWSSSTYWPYANGDTLHDLCQRFRARQRLVPEVLVWQALCHLLKAHEALHLSGRSHSDAHAGNVLVHWDGTSHLPDFILGDLGLCRPLPQDYVPGDCEHLETDYIMDGPGSAKVVGMINARLDPRLDPRLGSPTMQQVYEYDEAETAAAFAGTVMERFFFPKALMLMGKDMADVSECLSSLMNGLEFDETETYSPELNHFAQLLFNVAAYGRSVYVRTLQRWQLMFKQVRITAEFGLANAISRTSLPVPGRELLGPAPRDGRPVLFESVQALHACDMKPPGPWHVAAVDPDTLQVLGVDFSRSFCDDEHMCTDSRGVKIDLCPSSYDGSDSSGLQWQV